MMSCSVIFVRSASWSSLAGDPARPLLQLGQHALDFLVVLTQDREHVRHLSLLDSGCPWPASLPSLTRVNPPNPSPVRSKSARKYARNASRPKATLPWTLNPPRWKAGDGWRGAAV